jgi:hypothetical protein
MITTINQFKNHLNENKQLEAYAISIGVINILTGKTMYDWSIYDNSNSYVYYTGSNLLYAVEGTFEIGDNVLLKNNDTNRKINNYTIVDSCKCIKDDVINMLLKHGYDYRPARAFKKKQFDRKLMTSFSIKGVKNINESITSTHFTNDDLEMVKQKYNDAYLENDMICYSENGEKYCLINFDNRIEILKYDNEFNEYNDYKIINSLNELNESTKKGEWTLSSSGTPDMYRFSGKTFTQISYNKKLNKLIARDDNGKNASESITTNDISVNGVNYLLNSISKPHPTPQQINEFINRISENELNESVIKSPEETWNALPPYKRFFLMDNIPGIKDEEWD